MSLTEAQKAVPSHEPEEESSRTYTVRELIQTLAQLPDMDTEVSVSLFNSDAIPLAEVNADDESVVVLTGRIG